MNGGTQARLVNRRPVTTISDRGKSLTILGFHVCGCPFPLLLWLHGCIFVSSWAVLGAVVCVLGLREFSKHQRVFMAVDMPGRPFFFLCSVINLYVITVGSSFGHWRVVHLGFGVYSTWCEAGDHCLSLYELPLKLMYSK